MELYSFIHGNSPYSFLSPPPLPYLYSPPQSYVHWTQTPDSHIYTANLPGVRKEEIRVEVEDGRYLVIRTDLLEEEEEDELRGEEQRLRSFERKFRLPERVEVDRISAGYEDGVLTVRVPRRQRVPDVVVDLGVVEDARVARAA